MVGGLDGFDGDEQYEDIGEDADCYACLGVGGYWTTGDDMPECDAFDGCVCGMCSWVVCGTCSGRG